MRHSRFPSTSRSGVPARLLVRRLALVQEKDRLELRAHRAQEAEPAFLRPAVRPLVRKDDAVLIGLGAQRDDQPAARAPDAVGADVVLLERPQRLVVVDEDAVLAPGAEVARRLLLRVGEREVHDVVRAPLEVLDALLGADDVVRRSDQRRERAGLRLLVADCPERLDLRHGGSVAASRRHPCR